MKQGPDTIERHIMLRHVWFGLIPIVLTPIPEIVFYQTAYIAGASDRWASEPMFLYVRMMYALLPIAILAGLWLIVFMLVCMCRYKNIKAWLCACLLSLPVFGHFMDKEWLRFQLNKGKFTQEISRIEKNDKVPGPICLFDNHIEDRFYVGGSAYNFDQYIVYSRIQLRSENIQKIAHLTNCADIDKVNRLRQLDGDFYLIDSAG